MAKKTVKLPCPECGTILELEYGFFNMSGKCPKCNHKINIKQESMQTVTCENCRNDVIYDARKGEQQLCPVCGRQLKNKVMEKRFDRVNCPRCGSPNDVKLSEEICTCAVCGNSFPVHPQVAKQDVLNSNVGLVITAPEQEDFIIWRHPMSSFPYSSQLVVPEGMTALLRRNGRCNQPALPGRYTLSDSRLHLNDRLEQIMRGSDEQLTMDVFFVRNRFTRSMRWGGAQGTVENKRGEIAGVVGGRGDMTLRIADSLRFADNFGYRMMKEDDLLWIRETEPYEESPLYTRVRKAAYDGMLLAVRSLTQQYQWSFDQLKAHRLEIQSAAREQADMLLAPLGLQAGSYSVEDVFFKEDEKERQRKENKKKIVLLVEQQNHWAAMPTTVHMKDKAALSAQITLEGDYKLQVTDPSVFMSRSEMDHWIENGASSAEVAAYCTKMINEQAKNVFSDVLQPMIDNYDVDVRELSRYFRFLRDTVQGSLNNKLAAYGLQIEQFSMEVKSMVPSAALSQLTTFSSYKEEAVISQEMREFNQQMDLKRTDADSQTVLKKTAIELNRDSELDTLLQQREKLASQQEARRLDFERASLERQREMELLKKSWQRSDAQDEAGYAHRQVVEGLKQQNELDELSHDYRLRKNMRSAEEIRAEWEQRRQMEDAQLEAELHRQEKALTGDLHQQQIKQQYRQQNEQTEAENQRALQEIMNRIAESKLSMQEKLDAYERLSRSQRAQDENEALTGAAKAKADAQYSLEHMRLLLTKEQNGLMEEMDRLAEEREERRKSAEFQREMKQQESQVLHDMEQLKMQYEQAAKAAEMEERIVSQQAELEKLRLMLNNYEAMGRQDADVKIASINADSVRAKAEKEYELTKAQADREEARRIEQDRAKKENEFRDQAERLLTKMWEIQSVLGQMNIQTEHKKAEGQALADLVQAQGNRQDIKAVLEAMEKMTNGMNSLLKQAAAPQPAVPSWPVAPGARICPKCGRAVPQFSSLCQCGQYLG